MIAAIGQPTDSSPRTRMTMFNTIPTPMRISAAVLLFFMLIGRRLRLVVFTGK
jgi:hypothetical protein